MTVAGNDERPRMDWPGPAAGAVPSFLKLTCPQMHTGRDSPGYVAVVGRYLVLWCAKIGTSNYTRCV